MFLKYANLQSKYHLLEYNSDQNQEKLLQEIADIKNESKILDTKLKHQTALNEELDAKLNNCKICLELKEDNLRLEEINKKLNSRIESRTLMIEQEQKRLKELRILYEKGIKELNDLKEEHIRLREKFQEECKINDHN